MQALLVKDLLVQNSLIHIFIVSGSHFLLLHKILAKLPIVRRHTLFILFGYALMTLCQPPALRALLFLVLLKISERWKLFLSPVFLVFLSACLCVAVFPQWITSRSLLMSLLAALIIALMSEFWGKKQHTLPALFLTQSALYFVMAFPLWGFSDLHPLGVLLNLTLGPLIGGVLFPLGLLGAIVHPLAFLFDKALNLLIWILERNTGFYGLKTEASPLSLFFQWVFFVFLVGVSYWTLIWKKRQKALNG
ncbi:ComEC/Rec2 family competence protein [Bdellovibrio sp. HCB337]|uniref:ComEC/Rec2 family competence protein n=1 Tax=Bdellovibrio sp. HCB337 TaxID=3394358 RepID=UPI0039A47A7F